MILLVYHGFCEPGILRKCFSLKYKNFARIVQDKEIFLKNGYFDLCFMS